MKEFFWSLEDRHVTYVEENKIGGWGGQAALRGSRKSSQQETCEHVQEQLEHSWSTAGAQLVKAWTCQYTCRAPGHS